MICPQINSLSSGKSLRVACSINQEQVYAIVDTAADVSLISESLYLRLAKEVPIIRQANLAAAGQGQVITAKQIGYSGYTCISRNHNVFYNIVCRAN